MTDVYRMDRTAQVYREQPARQAQKAYEGHADLDGQLVAELYSRPAVSIRDLRNSDVIGTP